MGPLGSYRCDLRMLTGAYPFDDNSPGAWRASASTVPFTPVAKYVPEAVQRWQELFEHGFARELNCSDFDTLIWPHSIL
jgi:hypothetical protein